MNNLARGILAVCTVFFLTATYPIGANVSSENYDDTPPDPPQIYGPTDCKVWVKYDYNITITDPDDDRLTELYVKFGDGTNLTLKPPGSGCCKGWRSGITLVVSHKWKKSGDYSVEAKVRDIRWNWSDWGMLDVHVPKYKCKVENPAEAEANVIEPELFILMKRFLMGHTINSEPKFLIRFWQ